MLKKIVLMVMMVSSVSAMWSQENGVENCLKNSIELFPAIEINMFQYGRKITPKDELIAGYILYLPAVMNEITYPGTQTVHALELGYRRYLWRGLNIELDILPQYVLCEDTNTIQNHRVFNLVTELRFGYRFDFNVGKLPCLVNIQWFAGYYAVDNRPQSFIDADIERNLYPIYVSPIPIVFFGVSF